MPNLTPGSPSNPNRSDGGSHQSGSWTPGPWDLMVKMQGFTAVGAKTLIARVFSEAFKDLANEQANANLIAAAPDLYAALEDMLWPIMAGCQKPHIVRCMCAKCVEDRAKAALAKARGEA